MRFNVIELERQIGAMGEWYHQFPTDPEDIWTLYLPVGGIAAVFIYILHVWPVGGKAAVPPAA